MNAKSAYQLSLASSEENLKSLLGLIAEVAKRGELEITVVLSEFKWKSAKCQLDSLGYFTHFLRHNSDGTGSYSISWDLSKIKEKL